MRAKKHQHLHSPGIQSEFTLYVIMLLFNKWNGFVLLLHQLLVDAWTGALWNISEDKYKQGMVGNLTSKTVPDTRKKCHRRNQNCGNWRMGWLKIFPARDGAAVSNWSFDCQIAPNDCQLPINYCQHHLPVCLSHLFLSSMESSFPEGQWCRIDVVQ